MAIKSITKEQFEKGLKTLAINTSKEFNVKIEEVEKAIEEKLNLIEETSIDNEGNVIEIPYLERVQSLIRSLSLHFSKKNVNVQDLDEVYIYYVGRPNDFGKTKKIEEMKTIYKTNPQKAIEDGICNNKGEVLEQDGYDKGKPINMENLYQVSVLGSAVMTIDEKEKLVPINLILKGENINLNLKSFTKIKLKNVYVSSSKPEDKKISNDDKHIKWKEKLVKVFTNKNTEFELVGMFNENDIEKHINSGPLKSFKDETFQSIAEQRANKNYENFFVKKVDFNSGELDDTKNTGGSTVMNIVLAKSNDVNDIDDVFGYTEETKPFTGWFKGELNCQKEVKNAYVIGDSYMKNDAEKTLNLNIGGVWFLDKYKKFPNGKDFEKELKDLEKEEPKKEEPKKESSSTPIKTQPKEEPKKEEKVEEKVDEEEDYDDW